MKRVIAAFTLLLLMLNGCDNPRSEHIKATRAQMVGTWLAESVIHDERVRHVLTLDDGGKFIHRIAEHGPDDKAAQLEFAGEWSYDGTNLKRRFLKVNGRQYAGSGIRYATFPLISVSASEMVVDDNIQGVHMVYQRVADGTLP